MYWILIRGWRGRINVRTELKTFKHSSIERVGVRRIKHVDTLIQLEWRYDTKKLIKWLVIKMRSRSTNRSPPMTNTKRSKTRDLYLNPLYITERKTTPKLTDFRQDWAKRIFLLHRSLYCLFRFLWLKLISYYNSNWWQRAPQKSICISAWENNAESKLYRLYWPFEAKNWKIPWPD